MTNIEDMIKDLCPNGVEWKELGSCCDIVTSPTKLKKNEYKTEGRVAIIDQGEGFIAGYTNIEHYLPKDEYIIFGDHSEHIKFVNFPFVQGADGLKILKSKNGIASKYFYYCFCNFYQKEGSYKRHWSNAKTIFIPIPPLKIQEEIVKILDKFTDYVTELTSELTLRQKQYSFYRDKLLSFEDEVYEVEWKTLGEVADCLAGATPKTSNPSYWENGIIPWMSSGEVNKGFVYDTEKKITQEGYDSCSTKVVPKETVVIALAGQGRTRGTVAITKIELCTNQSLCSIVPKDDVNSHYLYYYLKGQYQKFRDISSGEGTRGGLNLKMIRDFRIPVPPLPIQSRIVQVLDNFDTVCNDLNIGLPKEIELRQKQYEFFRDKLLTFTAVGVYTDSTVQTRPD
ncbi:restriction endonuclease subunit S [Streptococcus mutans]|uniref:restriction endonuclease subunit S n=1 Tax=Streptococcus mutans TaxID=1309 RepID=UPI0038BBDF5E